MSVYYFTLIVEGVDVLHPDTMSELFELCEDMVPGHRQGEQFLDFDRSAGSMEQAIRSATRDAEKIEGLRVVRAVAGD